MKIRVRLNDSDFIDREVTSEPMIIGRGKQSDIRIVSEGISRQHARIYKEGDDCYIEDLASANGILINDKKVKIEKLAPGTQAYLAGECSVELLSGDQDVPIQKDSSAGKFSTKRRRNKISVSQESVGVNKNLVTALIVCCALAFIYFFNGADEPAQISKTKAPGIEATIKRPPKAASQVPKARPSKEYCKEAWIQQLCLAFNIKGGSLYGFAAEENRVVGRLDYRKILKKSPKAFDDDKELKKWLSNELKAGNFQDLKNEGKAILVIDFVSQGFRKEIKYKRAIIEARAFYGATAKSDGSLVYDKSAKSKLFNYIKIERL